MANVHTAAFKLRDVDRAGFFAQRIVFKIEAVQADPVSPRDLQRVGTATVDPKEFLTHESTGSGSAKSGMPSVGITEITKKSGIFAGTFYLYFRNKEDLLLQLLDDSVGRQDQRI